MMPLLAQFFSLALFYLLEAGLARGVGGCRSFAFAIPKSPSLHGAAIRRDLVSLYGERVYQGHALLISRISLEEERRKG